MNTLQRVSMLALALAGCASPPSSSEDTTSQDNALVFPSSRSAIRYDRDVILKDGIEVRATVRSLGYHKNIGIRVSVDGSAFLDVSGRYDGAVSGGLETWVTKFSPQAGWRRLEYALFYRDLGRGNSQHWDNNGGKNFVLNSADIVHRVGDAVRGQQLLVDLDVKNLAYDKSCSLTATATGWLGSSSAFARYVGPADRPGFERWQIEAPLDANNTRWTLGSKAAAYEYAVNCRIGGVEAWDNNNGRNFQWQRVAPPITEWSVSFTGAENVAVSPAGLTFVLSGGQWITGYEANGTWLFALDVGARVSDMFWSSNAGLVVKADGRWIAVASDASVLWTTSQDYQVIAAHTASGDFLVGPRGGALVTASTPSFFGPTNGCDVGQGLNETLPIVSDSGLFYCRVGATVVRYDLKTGLAGPTLTVSGYPFAAADDTLVLVAEDRTWLRGYSLAGSMVWEKQNVGVAVDTQYGYGQACPNHASGNTAVFRNTPSPDSSGNLVNEYIGFDVTTGAERFRQPSPSWGYNACPAADGQFYASESPYKYGWSVDRVSITGGRDRFLVGSGSAILSYSRDGQVAAREWPYYPNIMGRLFVRDSMGNEIFSKTFTSTAASEHRIVAEGNRIVLVEPNRVTQLRFE
jgi:hypothetical protein